VRLSPLTPGKDVGKISDEIIRHLTTLVGANAEITLEVSVTYPKGFDEKTVRVVSENAKTLKFEPFGFEEE